MQLWERVSEWLFLIILTIVGGWAALFQRRSNERERDWRKEQEVLAKKVEAQTERLAEHDKRLEVASVHIDRTHTDLTEIKGRIGNLHARITESTKALNDKIEAGNAALNDKLDRLLDRRNGN